MIKYSKIKFLCFSKFTNMHNLLAFITVCGVLSCATAEIENGLYRIENRDDQLHLTTDGGGSSFAPVVGENWLNFSEQKWTVTKETGHNGVEYTFVPKKYQTNNAMSYYKAPKSQYAVPEKWQINPIRNTGYYHIKSVRTGLCLTSDGRRRTLIQKTCDNFVHDQAWMFHKL